MGVITLLIPAFYSFGHFVRTQAQINVISDNLDFMEAAVRPDG